MKKFFLGSVIALILTEISSAPLKEAGAIGSINTANKEITVNVKPRMNLSMGDTLEVKGRNGRIILEVTFPMQTVVRCRIKSGGGISELSKGMPVFIPGTEDEPALKTGDTEKFGGMEFVYIAGGTFIMGSPEDEKGRRSDEKQHRVTVDSFRIGKYEVTQREYAEIMGENPSDIKGDNHPVEKVKWEEAVEFTRRFSRLHGVKARLPYEAEWEYACRGGTATRYFWGDEPDSRYAWYGAVSDDSTQPAGSRRPNPWGLHDMSGNVWEYCMDWHSADYYGKSPVLNPEGPAEGRARVLRGGSFQFDSTYMRSAARGILLPVMKNSGTGFRVVIAP